ncbi:MAG: BglG family transcription antiterminator [Bacillus sp. (in: firmicutes)]
MMDQRVTRLLEVLSQEQGIKLNQLQDKMQLTKRQTQYTIMKTNEWLTDNHLAPIESIRGKGLFLPEESSCWRSLIVDRNTSYYQLNEAERIPVALLYILADEEYMPLDWLAAQLSISRNTMLQTIKQIRVEEKIPLLNSRQHGYYIQLSEFEKRKLIYRVINQLLDMNHGKEWIEQITECQSEVDNCRKVLEEIEKQVGIKMADLPLTKLPYFIAVCFQRIKEDKGMNIDFENDPYIVNNRIYHVITNQFEELSKREAAFMTLIVLGANVTYRSDWVPEPIKQKVYAATIELIDRIEMLACITFCERDYLTELMIKHLQPAYYRFRYELTYDNPLLEVVETQYSDLHYLTCKAIEANSLLGKFHMSDHEKSYITLIIGSQLRREGTELNRRKHAIVVCQNGIAISALLLQTLRGLFPEILFLEHLACRDFERTNLEFDMVFSTVPLKTTKSLYLVPSMLNDLDKQKLKMKVHQQEFGLEIDGWSIETIISLAKACSSDFNEDIFKQRLSALSVDLNTKKGMTVERLPFIQTQRLQKLDTWQQAIKLSARPLLEEGIVESSYVERVMSDFDKQSDNPYMWLAPQVLIPHSGPGKDVNKAGFSILFLDEPYYLAGMKVKTIVLLAAVDQTAHLETLTALNSLFDELVMNDHSSSPSEEDFMEMLHNRVLERRKLVCI